MHARTRRRACGALTLATALLTCSLAQSTAAAAPPTLSPGAERRVVATVEQQLRAKYLPGVVVGVQRSGREPFVVSLGVADLEKRTPRQVADHVRIGSVTKAFVTTLVLRLAQDGRLSLDDPISRYVAGVPNGDAITLRRLGTMTSGLADFFANEQFTFEYLSGDTFTPPHMLELGFALPPRFAPGTGWSYSNTNTVLLGLVVERVEGAPLADVLERRILGPLGMRESSLPSSARLPRPFPKGYTRQTANRRLGDATFNTPTATWAAGGMVSTVGDLLRAAPMLGAGRPLLDEGTMRERRRWATFPPNARIQRYGFGVFDFNGWIGHNGGIPGYTTIAWNLPAKGMSLVVSVNSDIHVGKKDPDYAYEPASEVASELTRILTPGNVAPEAVKVR